MRNLFIIAVMFFLVSCQTTKGLKKTGNDNIKKYNLPPQSLEIGECGLFLWTLDDQNTLVFFQKQNAKKALYMDGDKQIDLTKANVKNTISTTDEFNIPYKARTYSHIELKGRFTETLQQGYRVRARLKAKKPDGWNIIIPLAGIYACK